MGQASVPSRFLLEIPAELMVGPDLAPPAGGGRGRRPRPRPRPRVRARRTTRFGTPIRSGGGGAFRQGSGRPGAPRAGRDVPADARPRRQARGVRGRRAIGIARDPPTRRRAADPGPSDQPRPIIPGERQFRDGDRVRHGRWGDGIVVTSKLTRSDEEVTVAFKDAAVGRKTVLASLANLEIIG